MLHGSMIAPDESQFAVSPSRVTEAGSGPDGGQAGFVVIPDAHLLFNCEFTRNGNDLKLVGEDGKTFVVQDYFKTDRPPALVTPEGAHLSGETIDAIAGDQAPGQYAQAGAQPGAGEAIGKVATSAGNATIVRNGVAITVNAGDVILKNDVLRTGGDGALGVIFNDGTTFSLTANAQMVVNEFVYQEGGANNQALFSLVRGSISFFASQVAKTGDMKVATPTATMGIRGTTVIVDIVVDTQTPGAIGQVNIKLYTDANGNVGRVEVFAPNGTLLGTLTQSATGFSIRPAGPLQAIAEQAQINPAEAARDLAILQSLFNSSNIGQQLLQQQQQQQTPNPNDRGDNTGPQNTGGSGSSTPTDIIVTVNTTTTQTGDGNTQTIITDVQITQPDGTTTPVITNPNPTTTPPDVTPETPPPPIVVDNVIIRGNGNDTIIGTSGNDDIYAGSGDDVILAGAGNDEVFGEVGNDILIAGEGEGNDVYDGGAGSDWVTFTSTSQGVVVNLANGTASGAETGNDTLIDIENVIGGDGNDSITGTSATNTLVGGAGADTIDGGGGADVILGGDGNDLILVRDGAGWTIDGGTGIDIIRLTGSFDIGGENEDEPFAQNVEILDLNANGASSVDLDADDIASIGTGGVLRIVGGEGDTVNISDQFDGHPNGQWRVADRGVAYEGDDATAGKLFDKYEFVDVVDGVETVLATVYVQQGVETNVNGQTGAPTANDDMADMAENETVLIDVLENDTDGGSGPVAITSVGSATIQGPNGVVLGLPEITVLNNQIRIAPGTAFDALAEGETATITIPYTMQNAVGEPATAVATVTVTGANDAPYFTYLPDDLETLGATGTGSINGVSAFKLTSSGASAAQIDEFLGLTEGSIFNLNAGATNGAAAAFDVLLAAGQTISFSWFFDAEDYLPYNDFAFFSVATDFTQKLSDVSLVRNFGDSGWQTMSFTADASGLYRLGFGVANVGDQALNSYLYIGGITGIGLNATVTEDDDEQTIDLLAGAHDLDANDTLTVINAIASANGQDGNEIDANAAVSFEGNSVTIDPTFFNYLAAGETVTVVVQYDVSDGHATTHNSATLVVTGADDSPETGNLTAQGFEDDATIPVALAGTDPEDGSVTTFRIASLPENGKLFTLTQDVSASMVEVNLNDLVTLGSTQFFFKPDANWNGTTSFTYAAVDVDGDVDQTPATATINVAPVNDAPVAQDDHVIVAADLLPEAGNTVQFPDFPLLRNDFDADGDPIAVTGVDGAGTWGSVAITQLGSIDYTAPTDWVAPEPGQSASVSFDYTASDGQSTTSATVTVTVQGGPNLAGTPDDDIMVVGAHGSADGGEGDDFIVGHGGTGNVFRFLEGGGHDTLYGFEAGQSGEDLIDLTDFGFDPDTFAAHISLGADEASTVIALPGGSITVLGVLPEDFAASDFLLASNNFLLQAA